MRRLAAAVVVLGSALVTAPAAAADRAATPPMGWNSWNHFHCGISERIVEATADAIVSSGLRDAGYRYVNVDDCWEAPSRDAGGRLQADPATFPSGIAALAAYAHARGLSFGLYTAAGATTCQGRPGSGGHYPQDAATFAAWGVDYVKFDWCGAKGVPHDLAAQFRAALDATGRPIVLGVSRHGSPWLWADHPADLWRTSADIRDSWSTMLRNAEGEAGLSARAGRDIGWNDPDMLEVGNGELAGDEYRAHFSLWALLAAPLLMGNDVRSMDADTRAILANRDVIAIDQDALGHPGDRVSTDGDREVWARQLAGGDGAVVLFNRGPYAATIRTHARRVGLPSASLYRVGNLWTHRDASSSGGLSAFVPPHGATMLRVSPARRVRAPGLTVLAVKPGSLPAGETTKVRVTLRDESGARVVHVRFKLEAPAGWTVRRLGARRTVAARTRPAWARFAVSAPPAAPSGRVRLQASATYRRGHGSARRLTVTDVAYVPPAAPVG